MKTTGEYAAAIPPPTELWHEPYMRASRGASCFCWDCLRSIGITSPPAFRHKHPDCLGKVFEESRVREAA